MQRVCSKSRIFHAENRIFQTNFMSLVNAKGYADSEKGHAELFILFKIYFYIILYILDIYLYNIYLKTCIPFRNPNILSIYIESLYCI